MGQWVRHVLLQDQTYKLVCKQQTLLSPHTKWKLLLTVWNKPSCWLSWYSIILTLLLSHCMPSLSASTNRQVGNSGGVLYYTEEHAWAAPTPPPPQLPPPSHSSLLPSILPDSGDSSYSFGFSLRTWNASTFQFSPARQRQRTLVRSPACIQFHLDLKAGSLDMLVEFQSVWSSWRWKVRIAALQCKRRLKKISCTLPELWQRTHSTLLILHLFSCGPLF